jgi:hypothetical protein
MTRATLKRRGTIIYPFEAIFGSGLGAGPPDVFGTGSPPARRARLAAIDGGSVEKSGCCVVSLGGGDIAPFVRGVAAASTGDTEFPFLCGWAVLAGAGRPVVGVALAARARASERGAMMLGGEAVTGGLDGDPMPGADVDPAAGETGAAWPLTGGLGLCLGEVPDVRSIFCSNSGGNAGTAAGDFSGPPAVAGVRAGPACLEGINCGAGLFVAEPFAGALPSAF